jgi:hypothetical protein
LGERETRRRIRMGGDGKDGRREDVRGKKGGTRNRRVVGQERERKED